MTDEEFKDLLERAKKGGHVVGAQMEPIRCVVFNDANGLWRRVFPSEEAFIACLDGEAQQAGLEAENASYVTGGGSTGRGPASRRGLSKYQAKQAARRLREDEEAEREEAEKAARKKAYHHKWYKEHYKPVSVDGRWLRGAIHRSREWVDSLDQAGRLVGRPAASDHPTTTPPNHAVPVTGEPGHRQRKFGLRGPNFVENERVSAFGPASAFLYLSENFWSVKFLLDEISGIVYPPASFQPIPTMDPVSTIADALNKRAMKKSSVKRAVKSRKTKRVKKPRVPKLHRPKKESTKTITTRLYKTWAAIVHARYNNHCAICGKEHSKDAPLNAHHIMPRQMFTALRFAPENGIALCPKCHKMGRFSAHKGGIWFAEWLRTHDPDKYQYCITWAHEDLDFKDRMRLYVAEEDLHDRYEDAIAPISRYKVIAYDKKGNKVESVVKAYNNRAAEYVFWNRWPGGYDGYEKLKGIYKTEQVEIPRWSEDDVEGMKKDLVDRGLMDSNGNEIYRQQTPRIADTVKMAIVQDWEAKNRK